MSDEFDSLADAGAEVLVRAMAADSWEAAKGLYVRLTRGREKQAERTRQALRNGAEAEQAAARAREVAGWSTRLRDDIDTHADLADEIRRLIAAQPNTATGPVSQSTHPGSGTVQQAAVSGASKITQIAAPAARSVRVDSPDHRSYRFSFPILPLFLRKVIAEHTAMSVIAVVAVGATAAGIVTAVSGPGNGPGIGGSYTTINGSSGTILIDPAYSPSGTLLATVNAMSGIVVWDVATGRPVTTLHDSTVANSGYDDQLSFDPAGDLLAAATDDGREVVLLNTTTWATVRTLTFPFANDQGAVRVKYSPDSAHLAIGDGAGTHVYLYRTSDYQLAETIPLSGSSEPVGTFSFSPDGKTMATATDYSGGGGTTVRLWNVATGRLSGSFTIPAADPSDLGTTSISYSPDGKYIATILDTNRVSIWSLAAGKVVGSWQVPLTLTQSTLTFSPDGKTLAVSNVSNAIYLYAVGQL